MFGLKIGMYLVHAKMHLCFLKMYAEWPHAKNKIIEYANSSYNHYMYLIHFFNTENHRIFKSLYITDFKRRIS